MFTRFLPGDEGRNGTIADTIALPEYNNIAPRVGFAWDVTGDGRTAVRGAAGVLYGTIRNQWNATADNQPLAIRQDWRTGTLSNPYSGANTAYTFGKSLEDTNLQDDKRLMQRCH